nr:FAD-dependent monooxygenase [Mycolicibacterium setense]
MASEVLIVGAGPTGLTMAVELARRGVLVRIVDAAVAPTTETRALGVQPRTLELFEKLDLAEAAVAIGVPVTEFNVFSEGKGSYTSIFTAWPRRTHTCSWRPNRKSRHCWRPGLRASASRWSVVLN